jgi:hypothetical protein
MHFQRKHNTTREDAVRRIDGFLEDLMRRPLPAGVTVKDPVKTWSGDTMSFSIKAKKGFMGATLTGRVDVDDENVTIEANLPALVTTFVPESKIREAFDKQFDAIFP